MAGKRGTHTDDMGSPNNVKPLRTVGRTPREGSKGGTHDDGFRSTKLTPRELPGAMDTGDVGTDRGNAPESLEFGKADPVRSHK